MSGKKDVTKKKKAAAGNISSKEYTIMQRKQVYAAEHDDASKGFGHLYNLSDQILSQMPASIDVLFADGEVPLFKPLFGLGMIPITVFARSRVYDGANIWVNDRVIENASIVGYDLVRPDKFVALSGPVEEVNISVIEQDAFNAMVGDGIATAYTIPNSTPFPDMLKSAPAVSPIYGNLDVSTDVTKLLSFFPDELFTLKNGAAPNTKKQIPIGKTGATRPSIKYDENNEITCKWQAEPHGAVVMKAFVDIVKNMRIYYTHMLFMDWLNSVAGDKLDEISEPCPQWEDGMMWKVTKDGEKVSPKEMLDIAMPMSGTSDFLTKLQSEIQTSQEQVFPLVQPTLKDYKIWLVIKTYTKQNTPAMPGTGLPYLDSNKWNIIQGTCFMLHRNTQHTYNVTDLNRDASLTYDPWPQREGGGDEDTWFIVKATYDYIKLMVDILKKDGLDADVFDPDETELLKRCKEWNSQVDKFGEMLGRA